MTTKKETKKETTATSIYALAQKVLNILNIGEDAKINNFFAREVKKFEKFIRDLKRNLTTLENQYTDDVDDINEKLIDAKEAVEDAKIAVTLDDVKTNDAADSFATIYWNNISAKTKEVERLEQKLKDLKDIFEKETQKVKDQIEKYQYRIDMIK